MPDNGDLDGPDSSKALYGILAECLKRLEVGEPVSGDEIASKYPEYQAEVEQFLADYYGLEGLVAPFRTEAALESARGDECPELLDHFADYELIEVLGRGGMAVVYKARHPRLERVVALKMVELSSPSAAKRFRLEAQIVATLDHPNIVPIYDVGEYEGRPFYTMKLFEGGSLADALANGKWSVGGGHRRSAQVIATVARAVHHAHEHNIFHRDLKPANILLDGDGQPHVADFGLARQVAVEPGVTQSGAIVGTPTYMPPEQAMGRKSGVATADVYALGAILYELLTARQVHSAPTPIEIILRVIECEPVHPRQLDRSIPRDLETICLKCLERDPEKRYPSAAALADDLARWLAGEPIHARRRTALSQGLRWVRRHPATNTLLLGLLTTAVTVTILLYERWQNAEARAAAIRQLSTVEALLTDKQRQLGEVERSLAAGRQEAQQMQETIRETRDFSRREVHARTLHLIGTELEKEHIHRAAHLLDQLRPEGGESDLRGFEWFHLWGRLHSNSRQVALHDEYVRWIELLPDGKHALTLAGNGVLALWDLGARETIPPPWRIPGHVSAAALAPDRRVLAVATEDGVVRFVDVTDGSEKVHKSMPATPNVMAFSPDGKTLATGAANGDVALETLTKIPFPGPCNRSWPVAEGGTPDGSPPAGRTGPSVGGLARPTRTSARRPSGPCPGRCRAVSAAAPGGPRSAGP
jgi:tRNA A-37 threonylcarbamoyl transferase component Bud32